MVGVELLLHSDPQSRSFSFILTICVHLADQSYPSAKRHGQYHPKLEKERTMLDADLHSLVLAYELHLDKDKDQADKRLLFRESYKSFKKREFKVLNGVCHDYSLYMKVSHPSQKSDRRDFHLFSLSLPSE